METEYFILNNIKYEIVSSSIDLYETSEGILLLPEITAKNDQIEHELSKLWLYHNNGFQTGVKKGGGIGRKKVCLGRSL